MKPIVFSRHALEQMADRGVTREEVEETIGTGEIMSARRGRLSVRRNFPYRADWKGRYYEVKQVMPNTVEDDTQVTVVTVYAFLFGVRE